MRFSGTPTLMAWAIISASGCQSAGSFAVSGGAFLTGSSGPEISSFSGEPVRAILFIWLWLWLALRTHCERIGGSLLSLGFFPVFAFEICSPLCIVVVRFSRTPLCHLAFALSAALALRSITRASSFSTLRLHNPASVCRILPSATRAESTCLKLPAGIPQSLASLGRSKLRGSARSYIIAMSVM